MSASIDPKAPCALCQLEVGPRPFALVTGGGTLQFCCEGCRGIYAMLHEIKETPGQPGDNQPK